MTDAIIVTGGAGFIGSNFVRFLFERTSRRLVVFDKLTYAGSLSNLEGILGDPRVTFVQADIADRTAVSQTFRTHSPSAIVNFAAESHVDRSIDGPGAFVDTNVVGTFVLLDAARGYLATEAPGARERFRFLHVSTDEVYGTLGATGLFAEETPYAPNSPYAASKAAADHFARAYHHTFGLPVIVTNCSNNYGPYQFPEKLIPLMILNALEGRALPIYGDGLNVRDWLYVEDHCAGVWLALERGRPGENYNIGGSNERTNIAIVDTICRALEARRPARDNPALAERGLTSYAQLKTYVPDRPGHDRRYGIDASKIQRELGWRAAHDFETAIARTVDWYLDHRAWCAGVQQGRYDRERLGVG
ncbi:MAG: dTDP-glucose 4,6-dehydratase [Vicinamibacterales bacterium]